MFVFFRDSSGVLFAQPGIVTRYHRSWPRAVPSSDEGGFYALPVRLLALMVPAAVLVATAFVFEAMFDMRLLGLRPFYLAAAFVVIFTFPVGWIAARLAPRSEGVSNGLEPAHDLNRRWTLYGSIFLSVLAVLSLGGLMLDAALRPAFAGFLFIALALLAATLRRDARAPAAE